jgi:hypothetical protein
MFCGMKPSFGSLHMGSIRISWWVGRVGLIRLVCIAGGVRGAQSTDSEGLHSNSRK